MTNHLTFFYRYQDLKLVPTGQGQRNLSKRPRRLNKGHGSKFRVGSQVRQGKPEDGRNTYWPKCWEYSNKNEDNSSKPLIIKIIKLRLRNSDNLVVSILFGLIISVYRYLPHWRSNEHCLSFDSSTIWLLMFL